VLGARLRAERQRRNLTLRELARRVNVSASLVSQIENGRVRPSVSTLMALVTELELSLDNLFSTMPSGDAGPADGVPEIDERVPGGANPEHRNEHFPPFDVSNLLPQTGATTWSKAQGAPPFLGGAWSALGVERPGSRAFLELESGVRWERLTPYSVPGMEFLHVRYEIGASSTAAGKHTRHQGIEFGYITSGTLHITVGFDEIVCDPGSSVMFDAATPHRLENRGDTAAEAVWLIIGRQSLVADAAPRPE
jgi:transcriptional regulator with XRE-family HTH domain/quercetin dioxygenase-like cupin family protein